MRRRLLREKMFKSILLRSCLSVDVQRFWNAAEGEKLASHSGVATTLIAGPTTNME